jgi:hypothetical protein
MIHRGHHAPVRGQFRMPGSLLESMGGSVLESAEGPGQSGNPAGKSKGRARFEEAFNDALITQGSAQEAAELLWQAARGKEPWPSRNCAAASPHRRNHFT